MSDNNLDGHINKVCGAVYCRDGFARRYTDPDDVGFERVCKWTALMLKQCKDVASIIISDEYEVKLVDDKGNSRECLCVASGLQNALFRVRPKEEAAFMGVETEIRHGVLHVQVMFDSVTYRQV